MLKLIPDHPWCRTFSPHLTTHPHYTLLLPDSNSAVKRAGSKYLSKLRVGPGHPPNWPWMALEEWETAGYWCIWKSGHVLSLNHEQSLHKISQSPTATIRDSNACTRSASKRLIVSYPDPWKGGRWIPSTKFCRSRQNLMILHVLSHTTRPIHHTSADLISILAETRVSPTHRLNLSWEYSQNAFQDLLKIYIKILAIIMFIGHVYFHNFQYMYTWLLAHLGSWPITDPQQADLVV